jgi:hypothetical protein
MMSKSTMTESDASRTESDASRTESDATQTEFDAGRALLLHTDMFPQFYVQTTRLLCHVLASGDVRQDAPVLVVERDAATMVLLRRQLTYHHVAQGEMAGEPWMISF